MKKKVAIVGLIVLLILLLDQLIKIYTKTNFSPYESTPLIGDWFVMEYIENPGMAFGTKFGSKFWHKLSLSLFRIIAIIGICYFWYQQAKKNAKTEFLIALGLIFAGATGNLIDSICYDYFFVFDPCFPFNIMEGSNNFQNCMGLKMEVRNSGFLMGNVVDMFKFHAFWPSWVPWLGDREVFPAIWNVADASITCGVLLIFIRQKSYFK